MRITNIHQVQRQGMRRRLHRTAARAGGTLLLVIFAAFWARAGGFYLPQQSARGTALGEAGLATPGEMSLLHRNPAALSFLDGTILSLGSTVVMSDTRFVPEGQSEIKMASQVLFPPNVMLSHTFESGLAFGVSGATPFAMRSDWGNNWPGARQAVLSEIRVAYVSPGAAFRLGSGAALGVALNVAFPRMQFSRKIPPHVAGAADPLETFDGSGATSYGLTVGLLLRPTSRISLGLSYTSSMKLAGDDASVSFTGMADSLANLYPTVRASTSMRTPAVASGGLAGALASWLRVEADVSYTFWSALRDMNFTYSAKDLASIGSSGQGIFLPWSIPFGWKDSWSFYSGIEIPLKGINLRAGYTFDQSPVPDGRVTPIIPDADRQGFSAGIGYWVSEGLRLDFAYQVLHFNDRTVSAAADSYLPGGGRYSTTWTVLGIGVSYLWD